MKGDIILGELTIPEPLRLKMREEERFDYCSSCPDLVANRKNVCWPRGSAKERFWIVGEAPGPTEDSRGLTFVGKSGRLLDGVLREAHINPDDIYVTNCVKCPPPKMRPPTDTEISNCTEKWLKMEISVLKPILVVCLGMTSARCIITNGGMMRNLHGLRYAPKKEFYDDNFFSVGVTYHPSAVLRGTVDRDVFLDDVRNYWKLYKGLKD